MITLASLKAFLSIPSADTTRDGALQTIVDGANQIVLDELRLTSVSVTAYEDRIDVDDESTAILMLSRIPLVAITQVTDGGVVVDPSLYRAMVDTGAVKRLGSSFWSCGREAVVVSYTAGWAGAPDAGLAYATMLIAAHAANTAPKSGLDSETIGQYSYRLADGSSSGSGGAGGFGIPPAAERILSSWRRVFTLPN